MKKELSTTKFTIILIFYYLLSIVGLHLLMPILEKLNNITFFNFLTFLTTILLCLLTCTTIIPNIVIKKTLKNKTITTKDYKIIKKNIIIVFIIILIGVLIYKTPNYIKQIEELPNPQISIGLYDSCSKGNLIADIRTEITKIIFIFISGTYYLIKDVNDYITPYKNQKKYYIKRTMYLLINYFIYSLIGLIGGLFHCVH